MSFLSCYGIIPARYASSRLPGKPLADIGGRPMFWHVWRRARRCRALKNVWVATDDERVAEAAAAWEVPWVLTSPDHPSGTDRVREAAVRLNLPMDAVIVNIQGDEPLLEPSMLDELTAPFTDESVGACTLATPLDPADPADAALIASPHQVKVVMDEAGDALYFSRAPIPFARDGSVPPRFAGHVGLYAFRRDVLERVTALPPSPLEQTEKLEQLRLLEHRIPLRVVLTRWRTRGVDTPEDLETVRALVAAEEARTL
ncbi:MAG: 3-deoxy-manno-octulosonate cytidylyltransferase [Desulfovibrionaceae bacterium]|nr:3-deoxy-manno-octulosonate cytidylyltransferase [Desulfovibrionaceae bacterium]